MFKLSSLHLSKLLDLLGYSPQMIHYRRAAYQELDRLATEHPAWKKVLTAGSKGEGLTKYCESDHDALYFLPNILCVEEELELHHAIIPHEETTITMERSPFFAGYTQLNMKHQGDSIHPVILESILVMGPSRYQLSSDEFSEQSKKLVKQQLPQGIVMENSSGVASRTSCGLFEGDTVLALPCKVPTILHQWLIRERPFDWPPPQLRERIAQMDGNVVAAGFNRSFSRFLEWRICFNEIEQLLTHSLNETQVKLYVILKMVTKDILQPDQKEITSYTMKNIVWWLSELYPSDQFNEQNLINWVFKALRLLQRSLRMKCLPYYMLPERNLLCENMTEYLRKRHIRTLTNMLKRRPCCLLGCKQLKKVKYMSFASLRRLSEQRDELETLQLTTINYMLCLKYQGLSEEEIRNDETNNAIIDRQIEIVNLPWPLHVQKQLDQVATVTEKIELLLH